MFLIFPLSSSQRKRESKKQTERQNVHRLPFNGVEDSGGANIADWATEWRQKWWKSKKIQSFMFCETDRCRTAKSSADWGKSTSCKMNLSKLWSAPAEELQSVNSYYKITSYGQHKAHLIRAWSFMACGFLWVLITFEYIVGFWELAGAFCRSEFFLGACSTLNC